MSCSDIIQAVLVGVLVIVTSYYAFQTRRQANLLKHQIDENRKAREKDERIRALGKVNEWVRGIQVVIGNPPMIMGGIDCNELRKNLLPFNTHIAEIFSEINEFSDKYWESFDSAVTGLEQYLGKLEKGEYNADEFLHTLTILLTDTIVERTSL